MKVKKLYSPLIVASLMGASLISVPVASAEESQACVTPAEQFSAQSAAVLNYAVNCDFEPNSYTAAKREWKFGGETGASIVKEDANSFGQITAESGDNYIWQIIPTVPGDSYEVSADVRVDNASDSVSFAAKSVDLNGAPIEQATTVVVSGLQMLEKGSSNGQWNRLSFTFTADNWNTAVGIVKETAKGEARSSIALDNLRVADTSKVYELLWSDEFDGDEVNGANWGYELGNIRGNEQQHYSSSKENVSVQDGKLTLKATQRPEKDQYYNTERHGDNARLVKYNSGSIRSEGRQNFLYGRLEASMKLPQGQGVFPAFWTLGSDFVLDGRINGEQGYAWPISGELDIMEIIGAVTPERAQAGDVGKDDQSNSRAYGTPHFYYADSPNPDKDGTYAPKAISSSLVTAQNYAEDYHVFGVNWTPEYIEWYVDNVVYNRMYFPSDRTTGQAFVEEELQRFQAAANSMNRPQYIQINFATGGNWAGDAGDYLAGQSVEVDWVRYYSTAEQTKAREAYYADRPALTGVTDKVMKAGSAENLLAGVGVNLAGYHVDYSINDEYTFVNSGAPEGRNEVRLVVKNSADTEALKALTPGVYSLHYTALKDGFKYAGRVEPTAKTDRKTVKLVVLPEQGLKAAGCTLADVELPQGWSWNNPQAAISQAQSFEAAYTQAEDPIAAELRRNVAITIPLSAIDTAGVAATCSSDSGEGGAASSGVEAEPQAGQSGSQGAGKDPNNGSVSASGADKDKAPSSLAKLSQTGAGLAVPALIAIMLVIVGVAAIRVRKARK